MVFLLVWDVRLYDIGLILLVFSSFSLVVFLVFPVSVPYSISCNTTRC